MKKLERFLINRKLLKEISLYKFVNELIICCRFFFNISEQQIEFKIVNLQGGLGRGPALAF